MSLGEASEKPRRTDFRDGEGNADERRYPQMNADLLECVDPGTGHAGAAAA